MTSRTGEPSCIQTSAQHRWIKRLGVEQDGAQATALQERVTGPGLTVVVKQEERLVRNLLLLEGRCAICPR